MRALTVRQPWAWAIVHGGKDVENRTRSLGPYRGPVAIHAAARKGDDLKYAQAAIQSPFFDHTILREKHSVPRGLEWLGGAHLHTGAILGVVDLVSVHRAWTVGVCGMDSDGRQTRPCSSWAMPDHHHLVLANPRPLPRPIPATGRLGLWLPNDELVAAVNDQLLAAVTS